jgi:type I restriction enzyme, S subunit
MKLETFFEKFEVLAEMPGAVGKLRELVLQLAVTGKLVPQDNRDEPATSLLESTAAERAKLVAAKRIKSRSTGSTDSKEQPFDVPSNWAWAKLSDVGYELGQKVPVKRFTYIDVGGIDSDKGRISDRVEKLEPGEAPSRARKIVARDTVIYSTVRPYLLNIAIVDQDFDPEPIASTAFGILHPFKGVNNRYLFYWLRSAPFTAYVEAAMKGMAYPAINDEKFYDGPIALPPLAEQQRIVAKVDELMALCDRLEAQQQERETRHTALARASLAQFADAPTPANLQFLFHPSYAVTPTELRKSILTLAVQGKLVPQDPGEGSAEEMLSTIASDKRRKSEAGNIKTDKKAWIKSVSEPPHDIPESWRWVRLQDVFEISRGGSPRPAGDPRYFGGSIPWITVGELTKDTGKHLFETATGLTEAGSERSRFINPGDLLLTNSGATLGVPKISQIRGCLNDGVAVLRRFHSFDLNEFAYLYLTHQTPAFRSVNQGMGQPNLNTPIIASWFFPCPPLSEQRRIVEKVNELMSLVDALESQLRTARRSGDQLADSLVTESIQERQ